VEYNRAELLVEQNSVELNRVDPLVERYNKSEGALYYKLSIEGL
jgi:hypothetical protein